jgi:hypothetical protein
VKHVFGWAWPWRSLTRPLVAAVAGFVPAVVLRAQGGLWWEIASAAVFVAIYVLGWLWMGPEPADREVWRRLFRRPN